MTNKCPYHNLDPHTTVQLLGSDGRLLQTATAQLLCETWHDTEPIREWLSEVLPASLGALE